LRQNTLAQVRVTEKRELLEIQAQAANPGAAVVTGPSGEAILAVDPRLAQLSRLQQELADLLTRFTERYPDVQRARAQIAALERETATTPAPAPADRRPSAGDVTTNVLAARIRQALAESDADLKTLKEEERRLRAALAAYEQRV